MLPNFTNTSPWSEKQINTIPLENSNESWKDLSERKKRSQESCLNDRFIPKKISSNLYELFVKENRE